MSFSDKINPFLVDMNNCLKNGQNNAALFIALALPDICSSTDMPRFGKTVKKRYTKWIDEYFIKQNGYDQNVTMSSTDVYLLRCAYLHSGVDKIIQKDVNAIIEKFVFVFSPSKIITAHRNSIINNGIATMQLDTHEFCREIEKSVNLFIEDSIDNKIVEDNSKNILHVQNIDNGFIF
ncbi:hypothetical protein [Leuconostoc mesenteroides]|uniref:hypothetical protein n=1 Tax=Leuconostoc mesenteroides TaxID=1245 RepID=UPI002247F9E5|nr:hypothetical protein [Leuconostoc mesenteroides]MCX2666597.1 hypothetical protein [Leuconostoc mesenteroides subsp. mesenteroides]